jgi:hypothetical protein
MTQAQFEAAEANESYINPASLHGAPPTPAHCEPAAFRSNPASPNLLFETRKATGRRARRWNAPPVNAPG